MSKKYKFEYIQKYQEPKFGEESMLIPYATIEPVEGYEVPKNEDTNALLPYCCPYHEAVFNGAKEFLEKFPDCCDNHRMFTHYSDFDKRNYETLPKKLVTQISYTQHIIEKELGADNWYRIIADYIEYNALSFGEMHGMFKGAGFYLYLQYLQYWLKHVENKLGARIERISEYVATWQGNFRELFYIHRERRDKLNKLVPVVNEEINLRSIMEEYMKNYAYGGVNFFTQKNRYNVVMTEFEFHTKFKEKLDLALDQINIYELAEEGKVINLKQLKLDLAKTCTGLMTSPKYKNSKVNWDSLLHWGQGTFSAIGMFGDLECSKEVNEAKQIEAKNQIHSKGFNFENEIADIKSKENKFFKAVSMDKVIQHFEVLTKVKNKNGEQFLNDKQLVDFVKLAFLEDGTINKISMKCPPREQGYAIKLFYNFYELAMENGHSNKTKPFIELIEKSFTNWNHKQIKSSFRKDITKRNWR